MAVRLNGSVVVTENISDVYNIWTNLENYPHFFSSIKKVTITGPATSRWTVQALGKQWDWDVVSTNVEINQKIAWKTEQSKFINLSGLINFQELATDRTKVTISLVYQPASGLSGYFMKLAFSNSQEIMTKLLRRFKAFAETRQAA